MKFVLFIALYILLHLFLINFFVNNLNANYITWLKPDLEITSGYAKSVNAGQIPIKDFRMEYPAFFSFIAMLLSPLSQDFQAFVYAFALIQLAFNIGIIFLLYKLLNKKWKLLLYCFSPTLLLYSWCRFDLIPIFFFLLAFYYFAKKSKLSATMAAIGTAFKFFPFVLPVIALIKNKRKYFFAATLIFLLLNIPFMILDFDNFLYPYTFQSNRGPNPDSFFGIFQNQLSFDLDMINIISFTLLAILLIFTDFKQNMLKNLIALLIIFLLTTKVYSPQFNLWLLPLLLIENANIILIIIWDVVNVLVFPFLYAHHEFYRFEIAILLRHLLLIIIFVKLRLYNLNVKQNLFYLKKQLSRLSN